MPNNNQSEIIALEQKLTALLGHQNYKNVKSACRGKWRGTYDYGIQFEDGQEFYISNGKRLYRETLEAKVQQYQFFKDNYKLLKTQTAAVIERDNRQAIKLGLAPVQFIDLQMEKDFYAPKIIKQYTYWIGAVIRHNSIETLEHETFFFFALLGNNTDSYFKEKINRKDDALGGIREFDTGKFTKIFLGYLS